MTEKSWTITLSILRQKSDGDPYRQKFPVEVTPDESVLDAVEKVWAKQDRSLNFRHACHHSSCGACGMRVNHQEKLTCITLIKDVTQNGGEILVEPLRNFPVLSDLVVDFGDFFNILDQIDCDQVLPDNIQPTGDGIRLHDQSHDSAFERLVDCLECGLCISACPIISTDPAYIGPAALGQEHLKWLQSPGNVPIDLLCQENGMWRCHSVYECSEVCPSFVEPGSRIMDLRRKTIAHQMKSWFSQSKAKR